MQQQADLPQRHVFLDFDGPLHSTLTLQGKNVGLIASSASTLRGAGFFAWADHLESVLAEAEAALPQQIAIIVHSSWRAQPWFSVPVIRQALGPLGQRVCGFTSTHLPRAQAVQELCDRLEIRDFIVIDDDTAAFEGTPLIDHLVRVNPLKGVADPKVSDCVRSWASRLPSQAIAPLRDDLNGAPPSP